MPFRTTAYQRKLEQAGVEHNIAQAHAEAMEEFVVSDTVTREYLDSRLAELKADVKGDIADLRGEMHASEARMIRWTIGIVGVAQGLAVALLRLT